jgi:hypothetical protein
MTKTKIKKLIKKDRITTRGMRWKLDYEGTVYVSYGTKADAVDEIYGFIGTKPKKKSKKKSKTKSPITIS